MRLRLKIALAVALPMALVVLLTGFIGRGLVEGSVMNIVKNDLQAAAVYSLEGIKNPNGDQYYYIDESGKLCNGSYMVINSDENLSALKTTSWETHINVLYTYSDVIVGGSFDVDVMVEIRGKQVPPEVSETVLGTGEPYFLKKYDVGRESFCMYFVPMYNTGEDTPVCMLATVKNRRLVQSDIDGIVRNIVILATVVAAIFAVLAIWLIYRHVVNRLERTIEAMDTLADGNLGVRIPRKDLRIRDEIGEVSRITIDLDRELQNLLSTLKGSTDSIYENAKQFKRVNDRVDLIYGRASKRSGNTMEVSGFENAESRAKSIILELKNSVHEVRSGILQDKNSIEVLDKYGGRIRAAISALREMAQETGRMSFSASMEAAKTGESAKGFAMVADRIRQLSDSLLETCESIDQMFTDVSESVKDGGRLAEDELRITEDQEEMIDRLEYVIQEARSALDGDAQNNRSNSEAVSEINMLVGSLANSSRDLSDIAEELKRQSDMYTLPEPEPEPGPEPEEGIPSDEEVTQELEQIVSRGFSEVEEVDAEVIPEAEEAASDTLDTLQEEMQESEESVLEEEPGQNVSEVSPEIEQIVAEAFTESAEISVNNK